MNDRIKVWDPFVRLFHWSLVALIAGTWLTADGPKILHEGMGYVIAGLVALRVIWGLIGPRHARFADFIRGPRPVLAHLRDLAAGRERRYLGHNPAGGAMIAALLLTVAGTALIGWLQTTDAFWGSSAMEEVHEVLATLILVLVGLHVAGVLVESLRHHENLVLSMLTGTKRPLSDKDRG
ncbi:MAG: cytochrome b/b6 domain-containing protein [Paracoccus sp. (in: a-proteobacteria)]|uniref:cytochrome b/b6 domain-containing protein n=1 Tax=Paracoccus sp. TaxID=267 RepID=UPI004059B7C9